MDETMFWIFAGHESWIKKLNVANRLFFLRYLVIYKVLDTIRYNIYAGMSIFIFNIYIYINWLAEFLASTVFLGGINFDAHVAGKFR